MLACERGNKLSEVEDRTEQLATDSKVRNTVRFYDPSCNVKCSSLLLFMSFVCFCVIFISGVEKRADCTDQLLEYSNLNDTANIGETFSTIEFLV